MAQKFGGAIGGAAVLWLLGACGYVPRTDEQMAAQALVEQPAEAIRVLWYLMSFIPAGVALLAILVARFYPLTTQRMDEIQEKLKLQRQ
jgi:GPH family glycoside/pentoside/hexuronide:cation symporter